MAKKAKTLEDTENKKTLKERILERSTVEGTDSLDKSEIFNVAPVPTAVPMLNVALSGEVFGGISPGMHTIAGPSRHFKTNFAILLARSFIRQYPDALVMLYDTELSNPEYYVNMGIPKDKIIHVPVKTVEDMNHDLSVQLDGLTRKDKIFVIFDSLGNAASNKEVRDALSGEDKTDMTRAKAIRSMLRVNVNTMKIKHIPFIVINHTYETMEMFSKQVMSGGTSPLLLSDVVWFISRSQDKDNEGLHGYHFNINIEKSRYVREKSRIPISVSFEGGINKWSGLLEMALEGGFIVKPKNGWYAVVDQETGEIQEPSMRESDFNEDGKFWKKILSETDLAKFIKEKYKLPEISMIADEDEV